MALSYASKPNITASPDGKPAAVYRKCESRDVLATQLGYFLQNRVIGMTEALAMLHTPAALGMAIAVLFQRGTL